MEQKIKQIREEFQAAESDRLPEFIQKYAHDSRSGVANLVERARKQLESLERERDRIYRMREYERRYGDRERLCGIDEVGRGPLAGPVVAGAVILPKDCEILYINDSKQLSEKMRLRLDQEIRQKALAVGIGVVGPERIDEINILNATYEAMREAIQNLAVKPDILLNDAVVIPGVSTEQVRIVKGDALSVSIAAASIVAKVFRDRLMTEYEKLFPGYGFASNKGYGSAAHIEAVRRLGPTAIHRRTFIGNFI